MFVNIGIANRLMKVSYKTGKLKIGNLNNGLIILSGYWFIWIKNGDVPNKIKATIMELAGELPKPNTVFEVCKEYPKPETVKDISLIYDVLERRKDVKDRLINTPIIFKHNYDLRLFQTDFPEKNIVALREDYFNLIDKDAIDLDVEGEPIGPTFDIKPDAGLYWYNDNCIVMLLPYQVKDNEVINAISDIDFSELEEA